MYPFYESLEYAHQFKQARTEAEKVREKTGDLRKMRRRVRKTLKTNKEFNIEKPGKWVGRYFTSSRAYRNAYCFARSEHDFYSRAFY